MAGFVDGEGSLTIWKQIRTGRSSPAYRPMITIANTKKQTLEVFTSEYGGKIYRDNESGKGPRGSTWADSFDWYCPVASAERFLSEIKQYLVLKGEQAKILLAFLSVRDTIRTRPRTKHGWLSPLTGAEIEQREQLYLSSRRLNKKGKSMAI